LDVAIDNMELAVDGGNQDMIPTEENMLDSVATAEEVKWGAGEWGTPEVEDSTGVLQY
jgi:hypothetical protein